MKGADPPAGVPEENVAQIQDIQTRIERGDATVIPMLLERIRQSSDKVLRRLLARAVSGLATCEYLRQIAKLYTHVDPHLRLWTLAAIIRLEDHRFYPLLVRGYVFDEDKRVRSACRRSLRRLSPPQRARLLEHMSTAQQAWMKEAAALARCMLDDIERDSFHAGTTSLDLDIAELQDADLGPRGNFPEPPTDDGEDAAPDPLACSALPGEDAVNEMWRTRREEARRSMGIAEAVARDGRESGDHRTFTRRDCPECGERIMVEAVLCRYCQAVFDQEELEQVQELAKVKVVPLPIRSPGHRGSALVLDLFVAVALTPFLGLGIAYLLLKDGIRGGQSLGKGAYKLRVVDVETGAPCSYKQSAMRNLVLLVPFVPMLEVVLLAARGTRAGDWWAGTRAVFTDDPPASALLAAASLALLSLLALTIVISAGAIQPS